MCQMLRDMCYVQRDAGSRMNTRLRGLDALADMHLGSCFVGVRLTSNGARMYKEPSNMRSLDLLDGGSLTER